MPATMKRNGQKTELEQEEEIIDKQLWYQFNGDGAARRGQCSLTVLSIDRFMSVARAMFP